MADLREKDDDVVMSSSLLLLTDGVADSDEVDVIDDGSNVDGGVVGAKAWTDTPRRAADTSLSVVMVD